MLSNKPYLIRAFYEWIVDSGCTPYVLINAAYPRCLVPVQFVENDQITLNVSPKAVRDMKVTKDALEFRASFSGAVHIISAPIKSILAIYAHENQQGMFFDYEEEEGGDGDGLEQTLKIPEIETDTKEKTRPNHLRLVD